MNVQRVLAGLDVGNGSTEVVLVDAGSFPPRPLAWDRAPTRGRKGSQRANLGAAALARRLARRSGLRIDAAVVTGQRPVDTLTATVTAPPPRTAPLRLLTAGSRTPGRPGVGCGVPVPVTAGCGPGPDVVLVVPAGVGFAVAAALVETWVRDSTRAGGARVAAVLVAGDEGVLLARRVPSLPVGVPVVDAVDTDAALAAERVAVEAATGGAPLQQLADPLRLAALFGLDDTERAAADALSLSLRDAPNAVVALDRTHRPADPGAAAATIGQLAVLVPQVLGGGLGAVRWFTLPGADPVPVDDVWLVDLAAAGASVEARRAAGTGRPVAVAALHLAPGGSAAAGDRAPAEVVAHELGVPVRSVGTEAAAARAGALTTPTARADAVVLDLGAGTLDLIDPDGTELVAAGAGDLVTAVVAAALGTSRSAADWVKRGPCRRLEGPHVLLGEDGGREFTERPAPGDAVGALTVPGPAGLLPFSRDLSPAEWRALRLRLKRAAIGDNLARLVAALPGGLRGRDVVLVGGVAGDPEILRVLDAALDGAAVGRADVAAALRMHDRTGPAGPAGGLGHRWAVAYGLTLLAEPLLAEPP